MPVLRTTARAVGFVFAAALLLAGSIACAATDAERPALKVALRPHVEATRADVVLGDVADLASPDLALLRRAMAVPLGRAPWAGQTVSLDAERTWQWLRRQTGLRADQVEWSGASTTEITTASREVSGESLVNLATAALQQHLASTVSRLGLAHPRIEVQAVSMPVGVSLPVDAGRFEVRPIGTAAISKNMLVWVDAFAGRRFVRTVGVRFAVQVFARVPTAASRLEGGTPLQPEMFVEREVDVAELRGFGSPAAFAADSAMTSGSFRLRRTMESGEVITPAAVQKVPAVARGEVATLTARMGAIALESRVEVLQDGQVGQTIRVKQTNGTGEVLARVSGPGQLDMQR